jgi:Glycosyltransferase family 92
MIGMCSGENLVLPTKRSIMTTHELAIAAIVRDEQPFMDEWLLYHRFLGADHFFLYDDNQEPGMEAFLAPHREYTTVIRWHNVHHQFPSKRGDRQTGAYLHCLANFLLEYQWVAFIDIDEFIVLNKHQNIKDFIDSFSDAQSISLNWHRFGHNGHYDDPKLVTAELTRRKLEPATLGKCITRCDAIDDIVSVHQCKLRNDSKIVDANGRPYEKALYPGKTDTACLNHYMCRSFTRWMGRPTRGDAHVVPSLPRDAWRFSKEECLRKFVTDVALDWNEHADNYLLSHKSTLEKAIQSIRSNEPNKTGDQA